MAETSYQDSSRSENILTMNRGFTYAGNMSYNFSSMIPYLLIIREELPNIEVKKTQPQLYETEILTSVTCREWEDQQFD